MSTPPLPAVFHSYFGTLEEQRHAGRSEEVFHACFGCGPDHPDGLYVRCFKTPEGVASPIIIPKKYEGPPGAAHGGIVAACLDEVLGGAVAPKMAIIWGLGMGLLGFIAPSAYLNGRVQRRQGA